MKQETQDSFWDRVRKTRGDRAHVRKYVQQGEWRKAEDDVERRNAFRARERRRKASIRDDRPGGPSDHPQRESIQGDTDDLQPVSFLPEGATVRRAIAKVEVNTQDSSDQGTGFLISPDLLLTNQHVIKDTAHARAATITFDYETDPLGRRSPVTIFELDPDRFELYSEEGNLDFALIAVGRKVQGPGQKGEFGYCPLANTPDRHQKGMNVNIIQHPGGVPKTIAVRNNLLTDRTDRFLLYETDTLQGSSGAPVFNDGWDVVALHHYGAPSDPGDGESPTIAVNEGIRISRIYTHLEAELPGLEEPKRELLHAALRLFESATPALPHVDRPRVTPEPTPESERGERKTPSVVIRRDGASIESPVDTRDGSTTFVVPIEITVRIPGAKTPAAPSTSGAGRLRGTSSARLTSQEAKKLDRNYANRNGFREDFIPGLAVDLDRILAPVQNLVTPLKDSESQAARGELKYQNFSVFLDSNHRLALLTATNIDGESYRSVDRKSGVAEGETWYIDRRIDRDAFIDQDFYTAWSHIFDRGHLTRRNDPTWGTKKEAERANADTFHFTNCSPQQWRFNQTIEFWQGIERYVLEKGVSDQPGEIRVSVLQGPVYLDAAGQDTSIFADDVQIPNAFWKLVLWRSPEGKSRAVALLADQDLLLDEFREGGSSMPDDDADVSVEEFRVTVADLESRTGLDLSAFRNFDTFSAAAAPGVGERARRLRLRNWSDLKL